MARQLQNGKSMRADHRHPSQQISAVVRKRRGMMVKCGLLKKILEVSASGSEFNFLLRNAIKNEP